MEYTYLKENYVLRGWSDFPYAIVNQNDGEPIFLRQMQFEFLEAFVGSLNISKDLQPDLKAMVETGINAGFLGRISTPIFLKPYQQYKKADCRYMRSVLWSITGACNLKCRHCYLSAHETKYGELSYEKCEEIIHQFEEANIGTVGLTGGEPLVRKDFWQIVDLLIEKKIAINNLFTNGLLVNQQIIDNLKQRKLNPIILVSFDGVGYHDWMRGVTGIEDKVIKSIKLIRKNGFYTVVNTVVHKGNLSSLIETYKLMKELGVDYWKIAPVMNTGNWKNQMHNSDGNTAIKEIFDAFLELISLYKSDNAPMRLSTGGLFSSSKSGSAWNNSYEKFYGVSDIMNQFACKSCKDCLYLMPDGKILPCISFCDTIIEKTAPSIFDMPLVKLLTASETLSMTNTLLKDVFSNNIKCNNCRHKFTCGSCRAQSAQDYDTFYDSDRFACYYYENNYRAKIESIMENEIRTY